jgi:hypothetical protein
MTEESDAWISVQMREVLRLKEPTLHLFLSRLFMIFRSMA